MIDGRAATCLHYNRGFQLIVILSEALKLQLHLNVLTGDHIDRADQRRFLWHGATLGE